MVFSEPGVDIGPSGTLHGQVKLRLPFLGSHGSLATTVDVDAQAAFGAEAVGQSGQVDAAVTLGGPVDLRLMLPAGRGAVTANLNTDGGVRLGLSLPAGVERLDGEVALKGPLGLTIPLPGSGVTLSLPATIDGAATLGTTAPGSFCLDVQGDFTSPLALRLPLAGGRGELAVDATLAGTATLRMGLPGGQGQLQVHGIATGPVALTLALPGGRGQLIARGSISTAATISMVVPEGRTKLNADDTITSDVELRVVLPHGGQVEARASIPGRLHSVVFLPSGRGEMEVAAPIHTTLHLKAVPIPGSGGLLTAAIAVDAAAEMTLTLPDRDPKLRLRFEAALPLAPLVRLLYAEVERQAPVEYIELGPPRLMSAHDLALSLYVEARKGVLAKIEVTAQLHIDPRSNRLDLSSIHAHGINTAGRAASGLYLNPRMFRPLRHTMLFDPSTMLPSGTHVESLAFKSVSPDRLVIVGAITLAGMRPSP